MRTPAFKEELERRRLGVRHVLEDLPCLSLERLPPYPPELNPVGSIWTHLKYGVLPNLVPDDVLRLDGVLNRHLRRAKQSPERLHSFFDKCPLPIRIPYG